MGNIMIRSEGDKQFYTLTYSYRNAENKPSRMEERLGDQLPEPSELRQRQEAFDYRIFQQMWQPEIEQITQTYRNHIATYPEGLQEKELRQFGVLFTHNSTKIEGSTLSYRDTQMLLEEGISPGGKPIEDVVEARMHMEAYRTMTTSINVPVNVQLMKAWHKQQFFRTKAGLAGKLCGIDYPYNVRIGNSQYQPPSWQQVEQHLALLNLWYLQNHKQKHPVYIAAKYHCWFIAIHPFADGNGRTGRLLMNFILFKNHCPMFDIEPRQKRQYFNALERSMKNENYLHFIGWFCRNYIKYTKNYLAFFGNGTN